MVANTFASSAFSRGVCRAELFPTRELGCSRSWRHRVEIISSVCFTLETICTFLRCRGLSHFHGSVWRGGASSIKPYVALGSSSCIDREMGAESS